MFTVLQLSSFSALINYYFPLPERLSLLVNLHVCMYVYMYITPTIYIHFQLGAKWLINFQIVHYPTFTLANP